MTAHAAADRAVAALAATQRTIVHRAQLLGCGLGRKAIAYRLDAGRLRVVFRGVYTVGYGELPPLAREQAAIFAGGDGAFLSHHTAAYLWGIRPLPPTEVDVSVVGPPRGRCRGLKLHRITTIDSRDLRRLQGLPLSSPARVLLELAAGLSASERELAFDQAIQRKLVDARELRAVLARHPGRRGAGVLRELLEQDPAAALTRSRAERRFLALLRRVELPPPEVNVALGRFVVDFLWRDERIVVEVDGFGFHGGRRSFESDRRRDVELRAAGYTVLRFTWRHLLHEPELALVRLGQVMALSLRARAG